MANDKLNVVLPKGTAIYPRLNKPDTKYKPEGEYSAKTRFSPDADDAVLNGKKVKWSVLHDALVKLRDDFLAEKKAELAASPKPEHKKKAKTIEAVDIGNPALDDEGEETGDITINAKTKASGVAKDGSPWTREPVLFDAKNKKLSVKQTQVYGGSTIKVACTAVPYYMPKENTVGISFYMDAVQIIDLVSGGGRSASAFGFGEEEGYEGDEQEDDAPPFAGDDSDKNDDF